MKHNKLLGGAVVAFGTGLVASAAHAGPIADAITAASDTLTAVATDTGGMAVPYLTAIAAVAGVLMIGGLVRRALGGGR